MVHGGMQWYIESNKNLSDFRREGAAVDCILDFVSSVEQANSRGNVTVATFLGINSAYDQPKHTEI